MNRTWSESVDARNSTKFKDIELSLWHFSHYGNDRLHRKWIAMSITPDYGIIFVWLCDIELFRQCFIWFLVWIRFGFRIATSFSWFRIFMQLGRIVTSNPEWLAKLYWMLESKLQIWSKIPGKGKNSRGLRKPVYVEITNFRCLARNDR